MLDVNELQRDAKRKSADSTRQQCTAEEYSDSFMYISGLNLRTSMISNGGAGATLIKWW
jgi:hypothetical protein